MPTASSSASSRRSPAIRFEGTEGWIASPSWVRPLQASPKSILDSVIKPDEVHLYTAPDEHRNFLDCVKSRKPCYAPAEIGHRTITIAHVGHIADALGPEAPVGPGQGAVRRRPRGRQDALAADARPVDAVTRRRKPRPARPSGFMQGAIACRLSRQRNPGQRQVRHVPGPAAEQMGHGRARPRRSRTPRVRRSGLPSVLRSVGGSPRPRPKRAPTASPPRSTSPKPAAGPPARTVQKRQHIGELVQPGPTWQMPGRIDPPRNSPSGDTRSTVIAVPTSTTTAGRPGVPQPVRRQGIQEPVDADHVGPLQRHPKRQVAGGQERDRVFAADWSAANRSAALRGPIHAPDPPRGRALLRSRAANRARIPPPRWPPRGRTWRPARAIPAAAPRGTSPRQTSRTSSGCFPRPRRSAETTAKRSFSSRQPHPTAAPRRRSTR